MTQDRTEKMNFDEKVGQITLGHPYDNIHDESCIGEFEAFILKLKEIRQIEND